MGWGERQRPFTERGRPVQGSDLKNNMEILWKKPGNNSEKLKHNVPGWKQQEEAGRAAGVGRSWILRKTARFALLFF